jgi:hypothetical protein
MLPPYATGDVRMCDRVKWIHDSLNSELEVKVNLAKVMCIASNLVQQPNWAKQSMVG